MNFGNLLFIILLLIVLFALMRNVVSRGEMKRLEAEAVVVHHDRRKWVPVCRALSGLGALLMVVNLFMSYLHGNMEFLSQSFFSILACMTAFLFFAIAPYDICEWLITEKGVYIYNTGGLIPWTQIITTGIQNKKRTKRVIIQIKKEQGEFFKAAYQLLGTDTLEEAEKISELIREFVHAMDRKKLFKKAQEEKNTAREKRQWY